MNENSPEDQVVLTMMGVLLRHPSEWLSPRQLSRVTRIEEALLSGLADYRRDLFAVSRGKIKLQTETVEAVSRAGLNKWKVPPPPRKSPGFARSGGSEPIGGADRRGCYCASAHSKILANLVDESVPDEALLNSCCWKTICRVRARNFSKIDPEIWVTLCARRGYLRDRENPRGF